MDPRFLRRILPEPVKWLGHGVLNLVDPIAVRRFRRRTGWRDPIPGRRLRTRVGAGRLEAYAHGGLRVARELEAILERHGRSIERCGAIYDFGSGPGRVLAQVRASPDARLAASDVDPEAIAWLRRHHPRVDARANDPLPPSPFEPGSFDLAYSISILTHLNEASQDAWLAEIARLLRPGGLAVLTTMGREALAKFRAGDRPGLSEDLRRRLAGHGSLATEGLVFEPVRRSVWTQGRFHGTEPDYGFAFHDHDYVRGRWGGFLDVIEIVPASINWGQDAVVARRRA